MATLWASTLASTSNAQVLANGIGLELAPPHTLTHDKKKLQLVLPPRTVKLESSIQQQLVRWVTEFW